MFQQEDALNDVIHQPFKCIGSSDATEMKSVVTVHRDTFTFSKKIEVIDENSFVGKDEFEDEFLDTTIDSNNSMASASREISIEFLESRNGEKYDRLVREVKILAPFKRRLYGTSRSNSPTFFDTVENEWEHVIEDVDVDVDALPSTITTNDHNRMEEVSTSHDAVIVELNHNKCRRCNQELETNVEVLARRQKQIDYGKNTIGYDNYIKLIPRSKRSKDHPWTPPKQFKYSRRAFDGLVKIWRTKLHCFDPPNYDGAIDDNNRADYYESSEL